MKTDIIVLTHNKEKIISDFYNKLTLELKGIKYNLIFVDNGSTDKTCEELLNLQKNDEDKIKIITLSKKYNNTNAAIAGLNYSKSDYACIYDFSFGIQYIKRLIECIKENDYDSISLCKSVKENKIQKLFTKFISKLLNVNILNNKTNFRIINKNMKKSLLSYSKNNTINEGIFDNMGFNIRYENVKSKLVDHNKILIPSNYKSILITLLSGSSLVLVSLIYLIITLITSHITIGYITIFLLLFLGGSILIFMGILNRNIVNNMSVINPNYVIKDKYGFDEDML